jgi:hypothetical protein
MQAPEGNWLGRLFSEQRTHHTSEFLTQADCYTHRHRLICVDLRNGSALYQARDPGTGVSLLRTAERVMWKK